RGAGDERRDRGDPRGRRAARARRARAARRRGARGGGRRAACALSATPPSDLRHFPNHFLTFAAFSLTHFAPAFSGLTWSPAIHLATVSWSEFDQVNFFIAA